MTSPRQLIERSTDGIPGRLLDWLTLLIWLAALMVGGMDRAEAQNNPAAPAASNPLQATLDRPLSKTTWPIWRETYLRIFYADDQDPREKAFYEQVQTFFASGIAASGGVMPSEFANDSMAWVALAWTYIHSAGSDGLPQSDRDRQLTLAEEASRKGIALGDPQAIASYTLAVSIIYRGRPRDASRSSSGGIDPRLTEAEERLRHVESISPQANVAVWRAQIAEQRGDKENAAALLTRALDAHPRSVSTAVAYLIHFLSPKDLSEKLADRSGPIAIRFPNEPQIQALHAMALYRDGRYTEAADSLQRARQLDENVTRFLGEKAVKAIEEGQQLTPAMISGLEALKKGQHEIAAAAFRKTLASDPRNALAARLLARSIAERLVSASSISRTSTGLAASEIGALGKGFPGDYEIQAALAAVLHLGGRDLEASQALNRVKQLGGQPEKLFDSATLAEIRQEAASDEATGHWESIALALVIGAIVWIGIMFAMGAILAVCIPRIPRSMSRTGLARSGGEVWLERFYLLVLSLGLLGFYASVPVVAAGLLAVTLALFGLLLVIRILHFGILQRGLWAFWNVLRCTLIGPQGDVLGIKVTNDEHPRLFEALRSVADRLKTRPVDIVYLTPSSNIAVTQTGSGPFGLLGTRQRVLQIGMSTLPQLSRDEFHSILAHEYGHFSQNDTFYGRFVFQVSASLATSLAVMSAAGGFLNYINPFYWFWWLYLRAYTLLANGFSRSREFLADRQAVSAYGKDAFVAGLTKAAVDGVLVESIVTTNIRHLLGQGKAFTNAFEVFRNCHEETAMAESRERLLDRLQRTKPRWLDTHPTFSERLAAVADFPDGTPAVENQPAIELLSDHQTLEARLTQMLTSAVHENINSHVINGSEHDGDD